MAHQITLNPGYPSEQTVDPQQLQVPDLWALAQALKDNGKDFFLRDVKILHVDASAGILETWHLAHALKEYIRKEAARMPYGPPLAICAGCMAEELAALPPNGAAYILATPADCQSMRHPELSPKTAPAGAEMATARDVVSSGPCYCPEHEHHNGVCMGPECRCHFDR